MAHVLIVGKETGGAAFAKVAAECGRTVMLTAEQRDSSADDLSDQSAQAPPISAVAWNKTSPISARAIIIGFENKVSKIDEALLFFDATAPGSELSAKNCLRALDDIAGYLYMTTELLARFSKKGGGNLIFLLKEGREDGDDAAGILPRTGAGAFRAFAESVARAYTRESFVRVFLLEATREQSDAQIAQWAFPYIDEASAPKPKWVKYGSKSGFGFLFNSKSYTK